MPINTIALAERMTSDFDKAVIQGSVTGFFADNHLKVKFVGADTVIIPELGLVGLGNYDRDKGFVQGSVTVTHTPYTLKMERGRTFSLDAQDVDESGISDMAAEVSADFLTYQIIPEIDAYNLSTLATIATDREQLVTTDGALASDAYSIFSKLKRKIRNKMGYNEELVCFINGDAEEGLETSPEISRHIVLSDFKQGEINTKVRKLNGITLIPVTDDRMFTKYTAYDGETEGQEYGGLNKAADAKTIGMLMLPKRACSFVKKTQKVRVWTPDRNINADAWKIDYRLYYDTFVKTSMLPGVCAYTY